MLLNRGQATPEGEPNQDRVSQKEKGEKAAGRVSRLPAFVICL
jgi:hypothetical protein